MRVSLLSVEEANAPHHCHWEESREGTKHQNGDIKPMTDYFRFQACEDEKDKRQDLYIKTRSYQEQLVARKSRMIKESDFHMVRKNTMLNIIKTFLTFPFHKVPPGHADVVSAESARPQAVWRYCGQHQPSEVVWQVPRRPNGVCELVEGDGLHVAREEVVFLAVLRCVMSSCLVSIIMKVNISI